MEGVRYCEDMGIPAKKLLKPNAIPTKFARPIPMVRVAGPHLRDLSLSSKTELHGPELVHEPPTKRNKPDMHHKGMVHEYLCIYIVLTNYNL